VLRSDLDQREDSTVQQTKRVVGFFYTCRRLEFVESAKTLLAATFVFSKRAKTVIVTTSYFTGATFHGPDRPAGLLPEQSSSRKTSAKRSSSMR
jgi:hypothetical protein